MEDNTKLTVNTNGIDGFKRITESVANLLRQIEISDYKDSLGHPFITNKAYTDLKELIMAFNKGNDIFECPNCHSKEIAVFNTISGYTCKCGCSMIKIVEKGQFIKPISKQRLEEMECENNRIKGSYIRIEEENKRLKKLNEEKDDKIRELKYAIKTIASEI